MNYMSGESSGQDAKLFSSLVGEISSLQEVLDVLENGSVSIDEAVGLVSGIQRDIVQLYRESRD